MKKIVSLLLSLTLLIACFSMFTACSGKPVLHIYNWADYIDPSVLDDFEATNGCKIVYDKFETNEKMLTKLTMSGAKYDIVFPSDYIIERMIADDMLLPIDYNNVPNFSNIMASAKDLAFDKGNLYSVPYMWGTVGILYNTKKVTQPVTSFDILWDEKYSGNIIMMDSVRDSLAVAFLKLGYSVNETDPARLEEAKQLLITQKPLVMAYLTDDAKDKMVRNEAALSVQYSGDAVYAMDKNEDLAYALPADGTNLWYDNMVIPKTSQNKELAEKFINYMCSPEIALRNVDYIGYCTPNTAAFDQLDDDIKNQPGIYPSDEYLAKCQLFHDLGDKTDDYNEMWQAIINS